MSPATEANHRAAYVDGLKMLARRELSEAQVRQRLAARGHDADAVEAAVTRLRAERALDDARVAEAIARTESAVKHRGKMRIRLQIERAGIAGPLARRAVDEVFNAIDADEQLEASLGRRLHGRDTIADRKEFERLYRYLVRQGFETERVINALKRRAKPGRSGRSGTGEPGESGRFEEE
jgi:regulatory protein